MLKNAEKVIFDGGMCIFVITSVSVSYGILAQMKCLRGHLKIIIKKVSTVMKSFLYVHVTYSKSSRYLKKMQGYPLENWFCTRLVVQLCTRNDRNDHFSKKKWQYFDNHFLFYPPLISLTSHHLSPFKYTHSHQYCLRRQYHTIATATTAAAATNITRWELNRLELGKRSSENYTGTWHPISQLVLNQLCCFLHKNLQQWTENTIALVRFVR